MHCKLPIPAKQRIKCIKAKEYLRFHCLIYILCYNCSLSYYAVNNATVRPNGNCLKENRWKTTTEDLLGSSTEFWTLCRRTEPSAFWQENWMKGWQKKGSNLGWSITLSKSRSTIQPISFYISYLPAMLVWEEERKKESFQASPVRKLLYNCMPW